MRVAHWGCQNLWLGGDPGCVFGAGAATVGEAIEASADLIHVGIMDADFVPGK